LFDAFAKQRLASRQSDLPHSPVDEQASDAGDLLEGEEKVPGEELVVATEDLLRHAVGAAEVATVGDRDTQVPDGTLEPVDEDERDLRHTPQPTARTGIRHARVASKRGNGGVVSGSQLR